MGLYKIAPVDFCRRLYEGESAYIAYQENGEWHNCFVEDLIPSDMDFVILESGKSLALDDYDKTWWAYDLEDDVK